MVLLAMTVLLLRNREYDAGSKWFRSYFIVAAITDLTLFILALYRINSLPVANMFSVCQFFMVSTAIIAWTNHSALKRMLYFSVALCALVFAIYTLGTLHKQQFDALSMTAQNMVLMLLSAVLLVRITNSTNDFLIKNHRFWFTVAVFVYFSVTTIVFSTANILLEGHTYIRRYTWDINSVMSIIANLMYLKAILCLPMKKTLSSQYS
jgi:hypothetical protein